MMFCKRGKGFPPCLGSSGGEGTVSLTAKPISSMSEPLTLHDSRAPGRVRNGVWASRLVARGTGGCAVNPSGAAEQDRSYHGSCGRRSRVGPDFGDPGGNHAKAREAVGQEAWWQQGHGQMSVGARLCLGAERQASCGVRVRQLMPSRPFLLTTQNPRQALGMATPFPRPCKVANPRYKGHTSDWMRKEAPQEGM